MIRHQTRLLSIVKKLQQHPDGHASNPCGVAQLDDLGERLVWNPDMICRYVARIFIYVRYR